MSKRKKIPRFLAWSVVLITSALSGQAMAQQVPPILDPDPVSITFTHEGCNLDGPQANPAGYDPDSSDIICDDADYTTGNLGKTWNELDLVPHRLTADAAGASAQTYDVVISGDNSRGPDEGYDFITQPVLNTALSSGSCSLTIIQENVDANIGIGGADDSVWHEVQITQSADSVCVWDYAMQLSTTASNLSGSSLQAALFADGVGEKRVPLTVGDIQGQEFAKEMTAVQDSVISWNVTKTVDPLNHVFGNTCKADTPTDQQVTVTIDWTKNPATPGLILITTSLKLTNPAARTVIVDLTDVILGDLGGGKVVLDNTFDTTVEVPPASMITVEHMVDVDANALDLMDKATAVFFVKSLVDGSLIEVGTGMAEASADVVLGTTVNNSATITDKEIIAGNGLSFVVDSVVPVIGSFTDADPTDGMVTWLSDSQSNSGSVEFNKTVSVERFLNTSGKLSDQATLNAEDFEATASASIGLSASALVDLTIEKTIPDILQGSEMAKVTLKVEGDIDGDGDQDSQDFVLIFAAGETFKSKTLTDLWPGDYLVTEESVTDGAGNLIGLVPEGGTSQTVSMPATSFETCVGKAAFNNVIPQDEFAKAEVKKITEPAPNTPNFDAVNDLQWTMTLEKPAGTIVETISVDSGASFSLFSTLLTEGGNYVINETLKDGWDNTLKSEDCDFTVNYPEDFGKTFSCTYKNVKRAMVDVIKTNTDQARNPLDPSGFQFQVRKDASAAENGETVATGASNVKGDVVFSCTGGALPEICLNLNGVAKLVPGEYALCEIVMPGWMTTLSGFVPNSFVPPDGVATNPTVDNSIVCVSIQLDPGETEAISVDNTPPPGGRALTIGFWKNWTSCDGKGSQDPELDRALAAATPPGIELGDLVLLGGGNPDVALNCDEAVSILDKRDLNGKKRASDPAYNMAAQLLAAKLNIAAGAGACGEIVVVITQAMALLDEIDFDGTKDHKKGRDKMSKDEANLANSLAKDLDDYNNNRFCI